MEEKRLECLLMLQIRQSDMILQALMLLLTDLPGNTRPEEPKLGARKAESGGGGSWGGAASPLPTS